MPKDLLIGLSLFKHEAAYQVISLLMKQSQHALLCNWCNTLLQFTIEVTVKITLGMFF